MANFSAFSLSQSSYFIVLKLCTATVPTKGKHYKIQAQNPARHFAQQK